MKNLKNKITIFFFLTSFLIIIPNVEPLLAQQTGAQGNTTTQTPSGNVVQIPNPFRSGTNTIDGLITIIIDSILIPVGGVVAVVMIIYAGFKYVTAGGDTAKIQKAHEALLWGVIGAAILLGAWAISQAISATIGELRTPN